MKNCNKWRLILVCVNVMLLYNISNVLAQDIVKIPLTPQPSGDTWQPFATVTWEADYCATNTSYISYPGNGVLKTTTSAAPKTKYKVVSSLNYGFIKGDMLSCQIKSSSGFNIYLKVKDTNDRYFYITYKSDPSATGEGVLSLYDSYLGSTNNYHQFKDGEWHTAAMDIGNDFYRLYAKKLKAISEIILGGEFEARDLKLYGHDSIPVLNGNFEQLGSDGAPTDWTWRGSDLFMISDGANHYVKKGWGWGLTQKVFLQPSEFYNIYVDLKKYDSSSAADAIIDIEYYDANDNPVPRTYDGYPDYIAFHYGADSGGWETMHNVFIPPANTSFAVIYLYTDTTGAYYYFDNLNISRSRALNNGNFENINNNGALTDWIYNTNDIMIVAEGNNHYVKSSGGGLTQGLEGLLWGSRYAFTVDVKQADVGARACVQVEYYDYYNNAITNDDFYYDASTGGWEKMLCSFTVPPLTATTAIRLLADLPGNHYYFDNAKIENTSDIILSSSPGVYDLLYPLSYMTDGNPNTEAGFEVGTSGDGAYAIQFRQIHTVDGIQLHQGEAAYYSSSYQIWGDRTGKGVFDTLLVNVPSNAAWGSWITHNLPNAVAVYGIKFQSLSGYSGGSRAHPTMFDFQARDTIFPEIVGLPALASTTPATNMVDNNENTAVSFAAGTSGEGSYTITYSGNGRTIDQIKILQGDDSYHSDGYRVFADVNGSGICDTLLIDAPITGWGGWATYNITPVKVYRIKFQSLSGYSVGARAHPSMYEFKIHEVQ